MPGVLHDAGEISISFGYGSRRDTDSAYGFVHDFCSYVLDQGLLKRRMFWKNPLHKDFYPLDLNVSRSDPETWVFDTDESNSGDPMRSIRTTRKHIGTMFDLDQ